jgi:ATP synthase protein I
MMTDLALPGKKIAVKGILVQLVVGVVLTLLGVGYDPNMLLSIGLGIGAFLVPHSFFAYWVFRYAGATKNKIVAQSMNQGMKLKLMLTFFIFVIAFSHFNAQPLFLLGSYVITMVSQSAAMFFLSRSL